jgi:hypothetical protein
MTFLHWSENIRSDAVYQGGIPPQNDGFSPNAQESLLGSVHYDICILCGYIVLIKSMVATPVSQCVT